MFKGASKSSTAQLQGAFKQNVSASFDHNRKLQKVQCSQGQAITGVIRTTNSSDFFEEEWYYFNDF